MYNCCSLMMIFHADFIVEVRRIKRLEKRHKQNLKNMLQKNRIVNIVLIFTAVLVFVGSLMSLINYMALKKDIIDVTLFFNESIEYDKIQMKNIVMFNLKLYAIFFVINVLFVKLAHVASDKFKKIHSIITKILFVGTFVLLLFWGVFGLFAFHEVFEFNRFYHLLYFDTLICFFAYTCIYSILQIIILSPFRVNN